MIAVIGLGRMGSQIAKKLHESGIKVIVSNRSAEPVNEAVKEGMIGAYEKGEVIEKFGNEKPIIWLMIPHEAMDLELESWLGILPKGSILVDGGNSDYRLTKNRFLLAKEKGVSYLDVGTSGGVWGYKNGFSMMAGGEEESFKEIE